jgi:hypothetical protein
MPFFVGIFEVVSVVLRKKPKLSWFKTSKTKQQHKNLKIMKKAILTIGLFSLVMVLTSFTTRETTTVIRVDNIETVNLAKNQAAGGNEKLDLVGNQGAGGNKKVD